jgi:RNA polymerase sigma factor (sigma-70 family)
VASDTLSDFLRRLGQSGGLQGDLTQTDAQLLERFALCRDEPAFAALLARHGPMVLGVCRQLLPDSRDAEDAFQAAFLVLAGKAAWIQHRSLLGPWLYGVAWRVAVRLRGRSARQHQREQIGIDLATVPGDAPAWSEVRWVVHEEVQRLPDGYRRVVVLCCLEGKSNEEAAELLRLPIGTVKSRLSRARELLRTRLTRRGLAVGEGVLGTVLVDATLQAASPFAVGAEGQVTARAVALSQEVLQTMMQKKITQAAALLLAVTVLGVVGGLVYQAWAGGAGEPPVQAVRLEEKPAPADRPKGDQEAILGTWRVTSVVVDGVERDNQRDGAAWRAKSSTWIFTAGKLVVKREAAGKDAPADSSEFRIKLDPTQTPRTLDLIRESGPDEVKGQTVRCIYSLEGDVLKICRRMWSPEVQYWNNMDGRAPKGLIRIGPYKLDPGALLGPGEVGRPTELSAKVDSKNQLLTLKR